MSNIFRTHKSRKNTCVIKKQRLLLSLFIIPMIYMCTYNSTFFDLKVTSKLITIDSIKFIETGEFISRIRAISREYSRFFSNTYRDHVLNDNITEPLASLPFSSNVTVYRMVPYIEWFDLSKIRRTVATIKYRVSLSFLRNM